MADQVVLMRDGRIEQDARARRALRAARHDLRGALRRHAADERDPGRADAGERASPPAVAAPTRLAIGIRPEAVALAARRHAGDGRGGRISRRRHADRRARSAEHIASSCALPGRVDAPAGRQRAARLGRRRRALVRSVVTASHRLDNEQRQPTREKHHGSQTISSTGTRGARRRRARRAARSRKARPRSRSSIRSRSAARSPRSSTAMRPTSRRRIPAIKVKPIYAGTYQETHHQGADRAQERHAAGDLGAALDRHVHADRRGRDRAVRRRSSRRDDDKKWLGELLPGASWRTARPAARPGACRSSARPSCSTGTRSCSRKPASTPTRRPANWDEMQSTSPRS